MKVNDILRTRDGRMIGNAIIVDVEEWGRFGTVYKVKTDYGNITHFTEGEIEGLFHPAQEHSPEDLPEDYPREVHKHYVPDGKHDDRCSGCRKLKDGFCCTSIDERLIANYWCQGEN